MQIVVLVMWWGEIELMLPLMEGAPLSTTPTDSGSLSTMHWNIYTKITARQGWQAGQLPKKGQRRWMDATCNSYLQFLQSEHLSPKLANFSPGSQPGTSVTRPLQRYFLWQRRNPSQICTQCHLGIQMLSCYSGMQRSATSSSAVWEKMHWASSPQIAFLHPPHHKYILDFGCSSHVGVAFGLNGCRGSAGWSTAKNMARRGQREKGAKWLLTARLRKEAISYRAKPVPLSMDSRTRDNRRRRLFPTALKIQIVPATLLGAACLLTQRESSKHFFTSWHCSQAILFPFFLLFSSLSSSPGTGHLSSVGDVFLRSLMEQSSVWE